MWEVRKCGGGAEGFASMKGEQECEEVKMMWISESRESEEYKMTRKVVEERGEGVEHCRGENH